MKFLITIFVFTVLMFSTQTEASHKEHEHGARGNAAEKEYRSAFAEAECEGMIAVKVNGLVCDFCARALEKVFGRQKGVAGIRVDLNKGLVVIAMSRGKTIDDGTITRLINDSGYNVNSIKRGC